MIDFVRPESFGFAQESLVEGSARMELISASLMELNPPPNA